MGGGPNDHIYITLGTEQEFCRNSTMFVRQISLDTPFNHAPVTLLHGSRLGSDVRVRVSGSSPDSETLDKPVSSPQSCCHCRLVGL